MNEYILSLIFANPAGDTTELNINDVKSEITEDQINKLMDTIIENNIFLNSKGRLTNKVGAKLTAKNTTEYDFSK